MTNRTDYQTAFVRVYNKSKLTHADVAKLLYVSHHTVIAWLKPISTRSHNPVPLWAVELLAYKTGQPIPRVSGSMIEAEGAALQVR